jgi:hypothetical protein
VASVLVWCVAAATVICTVHVCHRVTVTPQVPNPSTCRGRSWYRCAGTGSSAERGGAGGERGTLGHVSAGAACGIECAWPGSLHSRRLAPTLPVGAPSSHLARLRALAGYTAPRDKRALDRILRQSPPTIHCPPDDCYHIHRSLYRAGPPPRAPRPGAPRPRWGIPRGGPPRPVVSWVPLGAMS